MTHHLAPAVWLPIALALLAFLAFCYIELARHPAKALPKVVWAVIILMSVPLGGILFLIVGRGQQVTPESPVAPESPAWARDPDMDGPSARSVTAATPDIAVRTTGLSKVYGGGVGLHEVDLVVPARGVYGLVGPNGAGKTTLLTVLAGLRRAAGTVHATGQVMLCPDTPAFEPWLTAAETVSLFAADDADIDQALSLAGLADVRERRVGGFSRGMTQRLGLAVTLASGADVLLLDEPTSALDPQGRSDILDLVKALGHDHAVVMSSHILADVQRVADTVGVLRDGRLIYQGGVAELIDRHTRPSWRLHLRSGAQALEARLAGLPWVAGVKSVEGGLQVDTLTLAAGETLLPAQIAGSGAELVAFNPVGADLETVFLAMVGEVAA
jgi:ABC-2 type transport system ATP-binding protein